MGKTLKPWECLECGRKMTNAKARSIITGDGRCACGGVDIDIATTTRRV